MASNISWALKAMGPGSMRKAVIRNMLKVFMIISSLALVLVLNSLAFRPHLPMANIERNGTTFYIPSRFTTAFTKRAFSQVASLPSSVQTGVPLSREARNHRFQAHNQNFPSRKQDIAALDGCQEPEILAARLEAGVRTLKINDLLGPKEGGLMAIYTRLKAAKLGTQRKLLNSASILEWVSAGNARLFGLFPDDVLIGQNRECVRLCGLVELVAKILPS